MTRKALSIAQVGFATFVIELFAGLAYPLIHSGYYLVWDPPKHGLTPEEEPNKELMRKDPPKYIDSEERFHTRTH